jgi:UTP--glucose-1-phosphate uridylyltransferase
LTFTNALRGPVIAVETVPHEDVSKYGIVAVDESVDLGPDVFRIKDLVEKPAPHEAPSNLAIVGRYVLTPGHLPRARWPRPAIARVRSS